MPLLGTIFAPTVHMPRYSRLSHPSGNTVSTTGTDISISAVCRLLQGTSQIDLGPPIETTPDLFLHEPKGDSWMQTVVLRKRVRRIGRGCTPWRFSQKLLSVSARIPVGGIGGEPVGSHGEILRGRTPMGCRPDESTEGQCQTKSKDGHPPHRGSPTSRIVERNGDTGFRAQTYDPTCCFTNGPSSCKRMYY